MTHDSKGKFTSLKSKIRTFHRRFIIGTKIATLSILIVGTVLAIFHIVTSHTTYTQTVYAETEATTTTQTIPPILQKIARCESKTGHKANNGQVSYHVNTNGTIDSGKFMINTVWFAKATELGYDVFTEKGNEQMALWLYENKGTEPWYSSKSCWNK